VNGALIARGTAANLITFTSNQASPAKGDWKNIEFTDSSVDATFDGAGNYTGGGILEYCVVEYGGSSVIGAVETDIASPLIDHCTVRNSASSGIQAVGTNSTPVVIRNNTVSGNMWGILAFDGSSVISNIVNGNTNGGIGVLYYSTVTGNTVSGNSASDEGGGIYAKGSTVMGNTVSGNSASDEGGGIYAESSTVMGNTVSDNSAGFDGGGIYASYSTVTGNIVSGNSSSYGDGGGIYAAQSIVTGNIVSGNSVSNGRGGGIHASYSTVTGNTVNGNLAKICSGIDAETSPVTNNAVRDNSDGGICGADGQVMGNTVNDNSGNGIYARDSIGVMGNIVSGNSDGGIFAWDSPVISNTVTANSVSTWGSAVYFLGSGDFLYNTIIGNTAVSPTAMIGGVAIDGTPQFHHNNLYGNSNYDVVVLSSGDISGTHNYWGTVATVDILAHVYDWYDDSSRGRLLFIPYVQDPDPDAPVPPPQNLRANFTGGSASLSWDAIPSTTTGYSYKVYYDDACTPSYSGAGATQGDSPVDVGNATQFALSGLGSGGICIAVTAYDTRGRESWYSNEVSRPWRAYLLAVLKR